MAKTPNQDDLGVNVRIEGKALAAHIQIASGTNPDQLTVDLLTILLRQDGVQITKTVLARLEKLIIAYKENPKPCDVVIAAAPTPNTMASTKRGLLETETTAATPAAAMPQ